jgi:hypothetical protein
MSGYSGNSDLEAEHALIFAENGVQALRALLVGQVVIHCLDCGDVIPKARRDAAIKYGHKCEYCIECQTHHDTPHKVKMLDRIL